MHADLARNAKEREVVAWEQLKFPSLVKMGTDARWALTRKEVDGGETVMARFVANGSQDPDLGNGNVHVAGCVSRRSSHSQLISLGALKEWPLWTL